MQKQMHEKAWLLIVNGKYQVGSELFHSLDCVTLHTVPDEKLDTSKKRKGGGRATVQCRSDGWVEINMLISKQLCYESQQASSSSLQ